MSTPTSKSAPPNGGARNLFISAVAAGLAFCSLILAAPPNALTQTSVAPSTKALELRNLGFAQLENEKDQEAEATFAELARVYPQDPLGFANMAVAQLRQQNTSGALASINQADSKARGRADLLAIRADIVAWIGNTDAALQIYQQAAQKDPNNVEFLYALYRHTTSMSSEGAATAGRDAMARLTKLRPENLVVLLRHGIAAIEREDRATASEVYIRVRELTWQLDARTKPLADRTLPQLMKALEENDLANARVPAMRMENVFKGSGPFKSSLAEVYKGIQGIPVERFINEPQVGLDPPAKITFESRALHDRPGLKLAPVFTGEGPLQVLQSGRKASWLTPLDSGATAKQVGPARPASELLAVDIDNDGSVDVLTWDAATAGVLAYKGSDSGSGLTPAAPLAGLETVRATALDVLDFDSEGDLDVVLVTPEGRLRLYRNNLVDPLALAADQAVPQTAFRGATCIRSADLDNDGDTDFLIAHTGGLSFIDNNRQGTFSDRTEEAGLDRVGEARCVAIGDVNNDGLMDLLVEGNGSSSLLLQEAGSFRAATQQPQGSGPARFFDADNDGRLDIAFGGAKPTVAQQTVGGWRSVEITKLPEGGFADLAVADRDGDGDLDLIATQPGGLFWLQNNGGNEYEMLTVRLRGLTEGNDKNNIFGRGTSVEVRIGPSYQYREAREAVTHFGLGRAKRADVLRSVWANGVPQNRFQAETDQLIVEEQVLKGSCPFLYTWDGEQISFVTDLLWGAPLGMPVAPGHWAPSDPRELVQVTGAVPRTGDNGNYYDLRVTEELWEAAYFDTTRLWVAEAPADIEVHSTLRVFPGAHPEDFPGSASLIGVRDVQELAMALDGEGRDVTERVRSRDEIYADGYPVGDYQGIAARPWAFTLDLGRRPEGPFRLLLDGWIFPADASLNLAAAQRQDLDFTFTRLEVETESGWSTLLDPMGFPAGKSKTTVVDVPTLPAGSQRLRIVTSRWLHWDRIVWSETPADHEIKITAKLLPESATLRERGFSRLVRNAPNGPHVFDYNTVERQSPWMPMSGRYTRTGNVRELLLEEDDRLVVLAAGDEMRLRFPVDALPQTEAGHQRVVFLESLGWDKDADRNTFEATSAQPLPFRDMTGYPFAAGEKYPMSEQLQRYWDEWLTRVIPAASQSVPTGGR